MFHKFALGFVGASILLAACQPTNPSLSLDEAKKVTATFEGQSFVPPPRTIRDITAILDQQPLADPAAAEQLRQKAAGKPPPGADDKRLVQFYWNRGKAAGAIGKSLQQIADLKEAARRSSISHWETRLGVYWDLGSAEGSAGNLVDSIRYRERALGNIPADKESWALGRRAILSVFYAAAGDLEKAEQMLEQTEKSLSAATNFRSWPRNGDMWTANFEKAKGSVLEHRGRYREAEPVIRSALAHYKRDQEQNPDRNRGRYVIEVTHTSLATNLARQGRLIEAEVMVRKALTDVLERVGRKSPDTARIVRRMAEIILAQGRYAEAEQLVRATIEIYESAGVGPESVQLAFARLMLARSLGRQSKWTESLEQYDIVGKALPAGSSAREKIYSASTARAITLVKVGRPAEAVPIAEAAVKRMQATMGDKTFMSASALGYLAVTRMAAGDKAGALSDFTRAIPVILSESRQTEDEEGGEGGIDLGLKLILESYIGLLADIRGTPLERDAGLDAAAEAFQMAEVARGQSVQRALSASSARATAGDPALADLARREQDARKQISTLNSLLADALSRPTEQREPGAVDSLRTRIDQLRAARASLVEELTNRFPEYADLIDPKPATLESARAVLEPGEALISTFVGEDRSYVWAVPKVGQAAFASADLGREDLGDMVGVVRSSLEPNAATLGDIPPFEVETAYDLFNTLLAPVKAAWEKAESLLIVAHGPLGHLPMSLLPTQSRALAEESGALFSNHRAVPWLVRTHAVTVLPSVASLRTLRSLPPGAKDRKAFAGFGDPFFSTEQAVEKVVAKVATRGIGMRGRPVRLRAAPATAGLDSAQLGLLPRLPDTSDEIGSIAMVLKADLSQDVFLGKRANEGAVKQIDLSGYKVLVFATHGLVPGDLDGLTQPALALSAPEVAGVKGDGLLTMEEILALRLDADWVVLSACNTASGNGAGAEAVSGLGRAFFYAGTRALLVSNWPVETTSAKTLTTDLFRRQHDDPTLTRAQALRQTMLAMIDGKGYVDPASGKTVFSHAHPLFWAPFTLIGDGRGGTS